jgi:hypothetical protein
MKLRIQGDSLRLRVGPSEVRQLIDTGRIEETIHFAPASQLTYALEHSAAAACISVSHGPDEIVVVVPTSLAQSWAEGDDIGLYGSFPNGFGSLSIAVEKDFACLDPVEDANHDTYPNPKAAC